MTSEEELKKLLSELLEEYENAILSPGCQFPVNTELMERVVKSLEER